MSTDKQAAQAAPLTRAEQAKQAAEQAKQAAAQAAEQAAAKPDDSKLSAQAAQAAQAAARATIAAEQHAAQSWRNIEPSTKQAAAIACLRQLAPLARKLGASDAYPASFNANAEQVEKLFAKLGFRAPYDGKAKAADGILDNQVRFYISRRAKCIDGTIYDGYVALYLRYNGLVYSTSERAILAPSKQAAARNTQAQADIAEIANILAAL